MGYLLLGIDVVALVAVNLLGAAFGRKTAEFKNAASLYNLLTIAVALCVWGVLWAIDFSFDARVLWYAVGFGVSYFLANIGLILALSSGSVSLTSMLMQMSMIAATVWGFFFWNEKFTLLIGIGLVLVLVSLALCLLERGEKKSKITLKWLLSALVAFAGNAGCIIIQRTQQLVFKQQHGNMLMFFAMIFATLSCVVLLLKNKTEAPRTVIKRGGIFPVAVGILNAANNLIVILLADPKFGVSASFLFPVLSVAALAMTSILSLILFGDKLKPRQWVGVGIGAVAVLMLSL